MRARCGVVLAIYQIIVGAHTLINTNSLVRELAYADIVARHCPIFAHLRLKILVSRLNDIFLKETFREHQELIPRFTS